MMIMIDFFKNSLMVSCLLILYSCETMQDLAGLTKWQPAFAKPTASIGKSISKIAEKWMSTVFQNDLGKHPYRMQEGESERFQS